MLFDVVLAVAEKKQAGTDYSVDLVDLVKPIREALGQNDSKIADDFSLIVIARNGAED